MTSPMNIGGGGGGLCMLFIYLCGCVHSNLSLQYREPVVGGHLAGWRVGLPFAHIAPTGFEFAFFRLRVVCHGGGRSSVVVTTLRSSR